MNARIKREIRNKVRLVCCLVEVLEYDAANLKNDTNEYRPDDLAKTLQDTKEIIQNITDLLTEIEYILYLDSSRL